MLLTMQTECERVASLFPNPERIHKVNIQLPQPLCQKLYFVDSCIPTTLMNGKKADFSTQYRQVEESMNNLLDVIKERDRAVKLLEIGITGEPPTMECYGFTGLRHRYTYQEHLMPWWRNPK